MDKKRKAYAPFSLTSEAGVAQTPVEGYIDVNQSIYPTVNTGTINENGKWAGVKSDDLEFMGFTKAEGIASNGTFLAPDTNNHPSIDMTGFRHLQFAVKATNAGVVQLNAVLGPDTTKTLNIQPVEAGANARFLSASPLSTTTFDNVLNDASDNVFAGTWQLFTVLDRFTGFTNIQIKVTNKDASSNDYEFAFRRLV